VEVVDVSVFRSQPVPVSTKVQDFRSSGGAAGVLCVKKED
jgi:hypothetical protein